MRYQAPANIRSWLSGVAPCCSLQIPCLSFWTWVTSLSMIFSHSVHLPAIFMMLFLFYHWVILQCVDVPYFLYPFLSWGTFRLSGFGSCKWRYYEYSWTSFFVIWLSILWVYDQDCYIYLGLEVDWFSIFWETAYRLVVHVCILTSREEVFPLIPYPLQQRLPLMFLIFTILTGIRLYFRVI